MTMGGPHESGSRDIAAQPGVAVRRDAATYDTMYLSDDRTYDAPEASPYLPMFKAVVAEARRRGMRSILEVGCGSGTLARMLMASGVSQYSGFDIAAEGIRKA